MLKFSFFSILFVLLSSITNAQAKKIKLGFPPVEELEMKTYAKDTAASAVIMYEYGNAGIKYRDDDVRLYVDYTVRIKILKKEGLDRGDIVIPLRKSSRRKEEVSKIKAVSTTLKANGVHEKRWLKESDIYREEYNDDYILLKFAVPNVTVGSVIEYQYTLKSPFLYNFFPWELQEDIPKVYSEYQTSIPGNYKYNIKLVGNQKLDKNETGLKRECFVVGRGKADCSTATYIMRDIPAFIEEDYMLSAKNFKSKISYELEEVHFFDGKKDKYTKTWKSTDYELRSGENLGAQSRKENYFKKQLPEKLFSIEDPLEKAKNIYYYLQEKMTWNEKRNLFGKKDVKDVFEKNTGSVTEMNLVLLNSLKAGGLNANLMLLSTRDNGLPTKLYPVLSEFNYLVVKLDIGDTSYLLDITDKKLPFGLLPYKCLNSYGRVFNFKKGSYWFDIIADKYQTKSITQMNVKVDENGLITGDMREVNTGYFGLNKRQSFSKTNEDAYIEDMENSLSQISDFTINEFKIVNKNNYEKPLTETINFQIDNDNITSENIFFYPFMFNRFKTNPFQLKERTYPVNFGYSRVYNYRIAIEIPESMTYTEIPQNKTIKFQNETASLKINALQKGNILNIILKLNLDQPIYNAEDYNGLKTLFKELVAIQNKVPIVIQKKVK
ncbi:DUF3857 domain-containing protein [Flavobacteriaceae bacterium R38]|nr:DUF3857 domain-containing protein [Flavobacteriaceae bacterium R38]